MTVRLRHVAEVNPPTPEFDVMPDTAELPFLPLEAIWPGDRLDTTRRQPKAAVSSGYTRFREGDILLPKITPTFQADRTVIANGLEGGVGAGTTELHVIRAGPDADARYLRYLLSSKKFLDEGEASMIGVAGQKRVPDDCLRDLAVPVVHVQRQRAIADYLDRETGRIDALIVKKQQLVHLIGERRRAVRESVFLDRSGWKVKHLLKAPMAYGVLVPEFVDPGTGVRMIRISDIDGRGEVILDGVAWISESLSSQYRRTLVQPGDVVLSVVGSMGRAAVVSPGIPPANLNRPMARLQPRGELPGRLLWHWIQTEGFLDQARLAVGWGTAQPTLNLGDLAQFQVGLPPNPDDWWSLCWRLDQECQVFDSAEDTIRSQLRLLAEHRQALITAAVTGELAGPEAAA